MRTNRLSILLLILCFPFTIGWAQKTVDMTEEFLKLAEPVKFHDLGDKGFAVYDKGAEKVKFYDWNFKPINQITIKTGEGPGESKQNIFSVYIYQNKIYMNGLFERKILEFDPKGKYVNQFPLDFAPLYIIHRKNRLYMFKSTIDPSKDTLLLGIVSDPATGKKIKDILVKEKLFDLKTFHGNSWLAGISNSYDVDETGNVYLVNTGANLFAKIGPDNKLIKKIELPYKDRTIIHEGDSGVTISSLDYYTGIRVFKDGVYICFLKTVKDDKETGTKEYKTIILKILGNGKILEKTIDGEITIIGQYRDKLLLFETGDYKFIQLKTNEW
jgi:hypothetical protein